MQPQEVSLQSPKRNYVTRSKMSSPTPNSSQLSDPTESLGKTLDELESKLVRHAPRLRDSPRSQAIRERIAGLPERLDRHAHPTRERIENARGEGRQRRVGDEMEEEDEDQVDDPEADELEADELEADELEAEKQSSPQVSYEVKTPNLF